MDMLKQTKLTHELFGRFAKVIEEAGIHGDNFEGKLALLHALCDLIAMALNTCEDVDDATKAISREIIPETVEYFQKHPEENLWELVPDTKIYDFDKLRKRRREQGLQKGENDA